MMSHHALAFLSALRRAQTYGLLGRDRNGRWSEVIQLEFTSL
jgi:hypothetical protein